MLTVFNKPQFALIPDINGLRMYANVNNGIEIAGPNGEVRVAMVVPTELFVLMEHVLRVPPEDTVILHLDQTGNKYLFGLSHGSSTLVDLWTYSETSLPVWMTMDEYIVRPNTQKKISTSRQ